MLQPASSDAKIFLATGKQTLASKEASYNFGATRRAKYAASHRMSTEPRRFNSLRRNENRNPCGDGSSRLGRDERAQLARLRRLPRTPGGTTRGTVTTEGARSQPQARAQRRRNIVERGITVAAKFASGGAGTQPVATSQAFRINTLHGPTRQILQRSPPSISAGSK